MSESVTLEPIVIDTIERYFDLLQGHVTAHQMLDSVLTDDFETGFADGFRWRGPDGLTEFLDARSVFFDESHDVLQLINVTSPDEHTIQAQTRLRFSCGATNQGPQGAMNSPVRCGTPGVCGENRLRVGGEWPHKSSTDLLS